MGMERRVTSAPWPNLLLSVEVAQRISESEFMQLVLKSSILEFEVITAVNFEIVVHNRQVPISTLSFRLRYLVSHYTYLPLRCRCLCDDKSDLGRFSPLHRLSDLQRMTRAINGASHSWANASAGSATLFLGYIVF